MKKLPNFKGAPDVKRILNESVFYYLIYLKVNFELEKNKLTCWIFTQFYVCDDKSLPNFFGK